MMNDKFGALPPPFVIRHSKNSSFPLPLHLHYLQPHLPTAFISQHHLQQSS